MKTIYILRHAKSSWDNPSLADFERPLNERGLFAAPFMGQYFLKNNLQPELILSSPAFRAKQTAEIIKEKAEIANEIKFDERIYEASPQILMQIISEVSETCNSVMIVGHNPGLENLIKFLTGSIQPLPTAGLAIIDLEIEKWENLDLDTGKLRNFVHPREEMSSVA